MNDGPAIGRRMTFNSRRQEHQSVVGDAPDAYQMDPSLKGRAKYENSRDTIVNCVMGGVCIGMPLANWD